MLRCFFMVKYFKYITVGVICLIIYIIGISIYINENNNTKIYYNQNIMYTIYLDGEVNYIGEISVKKGSKLQDFIYDYLKPNADFTSFDENEVVENNKTYIVGYIEKININTADAKELQKIKNIGPDRSQNIISGRPYQKISDLVDKSIIGKDLYESIKNNIMV